MAEEKKYPQLAVIQIRGVVNVNVKAKDTLKMLNLEKKHNCVIIQGTPVYLGMLRRVKDIVTWGEVDAETIALLEKRRKSGNTYMLNPPRGGFERGGIKKSYQQGGVLGERGSAMNELIKRMV